MGSSCESLLNIKRTKSKTNNNKNPDEKKTQPNNKGSNLFCAPIDSSKNNDNMYIDNSSMSQMTMTMDQSQYQMNQKPQVYQYINLYKSNGLQKSIAKASLVELGGVGNSLIASNNKKNYRDNNNQTINSLYSSKVDDTGYESSYEGCEMIIDGKMNEELVKKSKDINTINNYNEFIKKNDIGNKKIMDYSKKNIIIGNKDLKTIEEDADELSGIPSGNIKQIKSDNILQKYIQSMGKY